MSATVIIIILAMGRWEPGGRGRLRQAALELYDECGYDNTTVAEIAERAGLTERTFFRHFADKREVLFDGAQLLQEAMVDAVQQAPPSATPLQAAGAGLDAAAEFLQDRDLSRRRQSVIDANAELRERELTKLATLSAAISETLRARGISEPTASLTGEVAVAVFRTAFARWVTEDTDRSLGELMREALRQLPSLTASEAVS